MALVECPGSTIDKENLLFYIKQILIFLAINVCIYINRFRIRKEKN